MKAWNCSWPIIFTFPKVSAAARPAISFVSLDSHIHAFFLKWGCQAFLFRGQERGHPWRKRSAHLVYDHDDVCPLASHNVGGHLGTLIMALATSGPAIIQRSRALGLSVRPTAPPSPLINALFCSCAWSIGSKRTGYSYSVQ